MGVVSGNRAEAANVLVDELTTSASPYVWQAIPALGDLGVVGLRELVSELTGAPAEGAGR